MQRIGNFQNCLEKKQDSMEGKSTIRDREEKKVLNITCHPEIENYATRRCSYFDVDSMVIDSDAVIRW